MNARISTHSRTRTLALVAIEAAQHDMVSEVLSGAVEELRLALERDREVVRAVDSLALVASAVAQHIRQTGGAETLRRQYLRVAQVAEQVADAIQRGAS